LEWYDGRRGNLAFLQEQLLELQPALGQLFAYVLVGCKRGTDVLLQVFYSLKLRHISIFAIS
jgi:hypothetical protein